MNADELLALIEAVAGDPARVPTLSVPVEAGDDPQTPFLLLAGAVDLVAERTSATADGIRRALRVLVGAESAFRFELHERAERAEELERAARMRGRHIAMTEGWLVPRLEREIDRFERRAAALERLVEEPR